MTDYRHSDGSTGHYGDDSPVNDPGEAFDGYTDEPRVRHDDGSTGHYAPEYGGDRPSSDPSDEPTEPRADYTWVIDRDYIADATPLERWGLDYVFADIVGPYNATTDTANLARTTGVAFRLYDDDGMLYYSGKLWGSDESTSNSEYAFAPLDDYGTPNAGAVTIKYKGESGAWETL